MAGAGAQHGHQRGRAPAPGPRSGGKPMTRALMRRLPEGGRIDRKREIAFTLEGRSMTGFAGDTLASALLGAGLTLVGRSFKYHRP
ncbi:MAG TPA: 2Fe-2S iron-sulfur cluster-binding protein, partial [Dongiaceae bacterium]|nr:2Fe-2S iron-sulfur cluster-binding protein [Dongiaceae bacterium]